MPITHVFDSVEAHISIDSVGGVARDGAARQGGNGGGMKVSVEKKKWLQSRELFGRCSRSYSKSENGLDKDTFLKKLYRYLAYT